MNLRRIEKKSVLVTGGYGFIGCALVDYLRAQGHAVDIIDLGLFGGEDIRRDYRHVSSRELDNYDAIVHLAAHSSVRMAINDPEAAIDNNLNGHYKLLQNINEQKFIYASSASVYFGHGNIKIKEDNKNFHVANVYDFTKHGADSLSTLYGKNYYALRFGTVNGFSRNTRFDVIINSMVRSSVINGEINVSNPLKHRSILALKDLVRAISIILSSPDAPGTYNLASFSSTVDDIAKNVSHSLGTPIRYNENTPTYDFVMDTEKFEQQFNFQFEENISSIIEDILKNKQFWINEKHQKR